jgi:hypothetical protein
MQSKILKLFLILFVSAPLLSAGQHSSAAKGTVKMGASQINITPQQPVLMSGYDKRKTPSTGVHDSLFASALFFSDGKNKALMITADVIGFRAAFVDTTKKMISEKTGIAADHILIIAEHNHGGPAIHTYEDKLPQANDDYVKELREKLVTVAFDAMKNPVAFSMGIGKGVCKLNINRRAVFADGGVWLGRDLDGPCDHELDAVKFVDEGNNLLAVLVNWPCHGTVSGEDNYQLTGDWPSSASRHIKNLVGKNIVVAVTAGASADINPIYGPGSDFNEVEAVGYHVGNETSKLIAQTKTYPVKSLEIVISTLSFPGKKTGKDQFPQPSYESAPGVEVRFTGLKLGDLVLCGISGELMTEMGMEIKKRSPYPSTIIVTHCNGSSGYICTDKAFKEGGYEVKVSHLMPGVEKPLVQKCLDMIHLF